MESKNLVTYDKVWMNEEMMMNDDNVESSLLTSSLLKMCCSVTNCTCRAVDGLNCRVPASMKCVVEVKCVGDMSIYSTTVYYCLHGSTKSHKSRGGRS